jgi:hypothetical protein
VVTAKIPYATDQRIFFSGSGILEARAAKFAVGKSPVSCAFQADRRVTDAIDGRRQVSRQCHDAGRRETPQLEKLVG